MLITIDIPDGATQLLYTEISKDGWESEPKKVTMDMFVGVAKQTATEEAPEEVPATIADLEGFLHRQAHMMMDMLKYGRPQAEIDAMVLAIKTTERRIERAEAAAKAERTVET